MRRRRAGRVTFEWVEGRHFLVQRSRNDLDDGVLRIRRDDSTFAQRFSATLGGDAFEGLWQLARTPGDRRDDLKVTYRRRA